MAMTYDSLAGSKTSAGSIALWTSYNKLDTTTVIAEAESILYQTLRVREMRTEWTFGMNVGDSQISLPDRFLDPIGRLYDITNSVWYPHNIESDILSYRAYDNSLVGTCGNNPFTTTAGSSLVNVFDMAHGVNQGSTVFFAGASAVDVLTLNSAFPVVQVIDANNFVIDTGTNAGAAVTGGGASVTYTANNLISASPSRWSIWDEQFKFDTAFDTQTTFKQLYYRSPVPLSVDNQSNWLVTRYPMLMRSATLVSAALFMKDDGEYTKNLSSLNALIASTAVGDDMLYRGANIETDTP